MTVSLSPLLGSLGKHIFGCKVHVLIDNLDEQLMIQETLIQVFGVLHVFFDIVVLLNTLTFKLFLKQTVQTFERFSIHNY